jgi:tripeptidyl-peptidase II
LLEKVNEAVIQASFKLASSLSLDIYKTFNTAVLANNKKITSLPMAGSSTKPIYVAPLSAEKVTKNAAPQSSWFEGQIILAKDELGRKVDINNFQYIITEGPPVKKANGNGNGPPKEVKTKAEEYKEGLRDYQCQMIAKLDGDDAENLYKEVLAAHPGFVGAHLSMIQSIETPSGNDLKNQLPFAFMKQLRDSATNIEESKLKLSKIAKLAGLVIEGINQEALLAYYGLKTDNRPDAVKIKQQMDKQKQQLLDAYVKKAVTMGKLSVIQENQENADEIDNLMTEAMKFADVNDLKVS